MFWVLIIELDIVIVLVLGVDVELLTVEILVRETKEHLFIEWFLILMGFRLVCAVCFDDSVSNRSITEFL